FDKDLSELTLGQLAYLAILPKGPANYEPFRKADRALKRRNFVLSEMLRNQFITDKQVFCDLLGNGRCTDRAAAALQIVQECRDNARIINAVMFKKRPILRRQKGADEQRRIFGIGEFNPAFARITVDRRAIDRAHIGGQRRLINAQRVDRGQIAQHQQPQ
ncbi:MAG: hypothetical protein DI607_08910, partial [Sphingomonas hengshuiensis]